MFEALLKGGIKPLLDAVYDILGWPVIFGDDSSNVIYQLPTTETGIEDFDYLLREKRVPMEIYIDFHKKYFDSMLKDTQYSMIIRDGLNEKRLQILNHIYVEGKVVATAVFHPTNEDPTSDELEVVRMFCRAATAEYQKLNRIDRFPVQRKLMALTMVLERHANSPSALDAAAKLSEDLPGGYLIILCLSGGDASTENLATFFCSTVIKMNVDAIPVTFEDNIIVLCGGIKKPFEQKEYPHFVQRILDLAKQFSMPAGVTTWFSKLSDTKAYYHQALYTARIGCKLEPKKAVYDFFDYSPLQVFAPALVGHDVNTFLHPVLIRILAWDNKYQTEYRKTLSAYLLSGRNNKQAAQNLSIHQNTLLYRISKIKEQFSINFSDTRLTTTLICNLLMLDVALPENE